MKDVVIVCETDGCDNKGKVVNELELMDCDLDGFMESFGHGGEDEADYCHECGKIGIAYEEPEFRNMLGEKSETDLAHERTRDGYAEG